MFTMGNLVYDAVGRVWALYRVAGTRPSERSEQGTPALLTTLARLGYEEAKLSWTESSYGPEGAGGVLLSVDVGAKGTGWTERMAAAKAAALPVAGAAAAAVLQPFGLGPVHPGRRLAARQRAAADRLVAALGAFPLHEATVGQACSALDDDVCGWREVRCCGYLAEAPGPSAARLPDGRSSEDGPHDGYVPGGRPRYRACFLTLPPAGSWGGWPVEVPVRPPAMWTACVRATRGGPVAALLARCEAGDVVDLGERAADLHRAARALGWDLVRPASGQALLSAAMAPGPAGHRRLPGRVFFPLGTARSVRPPSPRLVCSVPEPIQPSASAERQA